MATEINVPGSITDLANALSKLAKIFGVAGKAFEGGRNYLRHQKDRSAACDIAQIRFSPGGFRDILEAIAREGFDWHEVERLRAMLKATDEPIADCVTRITAYRDKLREDQGIRELDKLLQSLSVKSMIRNSLWELCNDTTDTPDDRAWMSRISLQLLADIHGLNEELAVLHDKILPPKVAATPRARKPRPTATKPE